MCRRRAAGPTDQDLTRLSLEELAMVEVTSVSRRPEALADAAAAIVVITSDDIRRSGAIRSAAVWRRRSGRKPPMAAR